MTAPASLLTEAYRVEAEPLWAICQLRGDDGYDRIEAAQSARWSAIPGWGRDGWDMGSWPLVVIFHRNTADAFELAENVEGDVTAYRFPTRELRDQATDELAFFHWQHNEEAWVAGIERFEDVPAHLRGPYSRTRS